MKKVAIYLTLIILSGCSTLPQNSEKVASNQTGNTCPEKPEGTLEGKNVQAISLSTNITKASGQASTSRLVGYAFEAKSGQKLSYRTQDNICIWIFAPDSQLLKTGDLPQTGKYTLQVSALQGSTTFNLEMTLGTLQASQPPVSTSTPTVTSSSIPQATTSNITQEQALEIVQNWYRAKPQIFAPPFDRTLVDRYATGKIHYNTTKSDPQSGRIAWLRANNSYYTYNESRINNVVEFSNSAGRPYITVNVYEDLVLRTPKGIDRANSGPYQANFIYFFEKDNGVWKISDYQKVR